MLNQIMNYAISSFINTLCVIYMISKLNEEKPNVKNVNFFIAIGLMTAIMLLNFLFVDNYLRIAICTIFTIFCCTLIFKTSFDIIISSVIVEQIILMFLECYQQSHHIFLHHSMFVDTMVLI